MPRQVEQGRATVRKPCWKRSWPEPLQCVHTSGCAAGRRAGAVAGLAGLLARNLDRRFGAGRTIPRTRSRGRSAGRSRAAARRAGAGRRRCRRTRRGRRGCRRCPRSRRTRSDRRPARAGAADAGVAEAIVERALVAVGEDRVGLGRLLELLFGRRVARDCDRGGTSARACGRRS